MLIWLLCLLLYTPIPSQAQSFSAKTKTDSLFQIALSLPDSISTKTKIKVFKKVLKEDSRYAPAHNQLAWLYLKQDRPSTRQSARFAIDRAIQFDPTNHAYQITKGAVLWSQGFYEDAVKHYKKTLANYPNSADAAYWLGYYYLNEFMNTKDRREYARSGAAGDGLTGFTMSSKNQDPAIKRMESQARLQAGAVITYAHEAQQELEQAITYLERSIQIAPNSRDAYYKLGLANLESGQPQKMLVSMNDLLSHFPKDKDALLFSGLASIAMGHPGKATQFFETAFEHMSFEERSILENVDLIVSKKNKGTLSRAFKTVSNKWIDPPEFEHFWLSQDPLFLTSFNERRIEHYARLAYANLWFSLPRAQVEGWRTDRGKTYIKYGRYRYRKSSDKGEAWFYEGFSFHFFNPLRGSLGGRIFNWHIGDILPNMAGPYMRDPWELVNADPYRRNQIEERRRHSYIRSLLDIPIQPSLKEVFKNTPARYIDPYKQQKYSLPHLLTAFREQDSIRLEIAYAVPKNRIQTTEDGQRNIIDGIFLFNEQWHEVYRNPAVVTLPASSTTSSTKNLRDRYFTTQHTVHTTPGNYHIAAEVLDQKSGSIGTFRSPYEILEPNDDFAVSDLLLATNISPKTPFPESREDLQINTNPLRTFHPTEPLYIYLELYNLKRNTFANTQYEIAYKISRPKNKNIDPALFADIDLPEGQIQIQLIEQKDAPTVYNVTYEVPKHNLINDWKNTKTPGLFKKHIETTITAQYEGHLKNDFTYLQIDITQIPIGVHELTVITHDILANKKNQKSTLFRITQ